MPGTETLAIIIEALGKAGIQYLLTHHETTAGNVAAVEGFLTGIPGVCIVTQGPGATNMVTAVANASLDRLPMMAVATTVGVDPAIQITHQKVPLASIFHPVAKRAEELTAGNVGRMLPELLDLACSPRPGPVFVSISGSEARTEVDGGDEPARTASPSGPSSPRQEFLERAAARIREAQRPALVAGAGLLEARAGAPLRRLVDRLGCPFALSMRAKGQLPEDHPLFVGTYGAKPASAIHDLLDSADLVVLIGLDGVEFSRPRGFKSPTLSLATLGADDPVFQPGLAVDGDLRQSLEWLSSEVEPKGGWGPGDVEECRRRTAQALKPNADSGLAPQTLFQLLREAMPRESIVTPDVGAHKQMFCQSWTSYEPGTFLTGTGYSPMGIGLGTAMAAKLVHPDRSVACVTGDGGLLMYAGELGPLARLGLAVTVIVLADGVLSGIKVKQEQRGYASAGVDLGNPDYVAVAKGFGLGTARAADPESFRAAIDAAMASEGPFLIQADINPREYR